MLDSLNEIDPVSNYTSSSAVSPYKLLTVSPSNIVQDNLPNPMSSFDQNKPVPSPQPGPQSDVLSDHLFEGNLLERKTS